MAVHSKPNEIQNLKSEIAELKQQLHELKTQLTAPRDLVCSSLKVVNNEKELVHIRSHEDRAGVITVHCENGDIAEINGLFYSEAIRLSAPRANKTYASIGRSPQGGQIEVHAINTKASSQFRVSPSTGRIETYNDSGTLSAHLP